MRSLNGLQAPIEQVGIKARLSAVGLKALSFALNTALQMVAGALISLAIKGITDLINYSKDLANEAQKLGETFQSSEEQIGSYQSRIEELNGVINDNHSSVEQVSEARVKLLDIQNEMIKKYGNEYKTVNSITKAINGQSDAYKELIALEYERAKNDVNNNVKWTHRLVNFVTNTTEFDRIINQVENFDAGIFSDHNDSKIREFLNNNLSNFNTLGKVSNESAGTNATFQFHGNVSLVQDEILQLKNLAEINNLSESFISQLDTMYQKTIKVSDSTRTMYNTYVAQEKIFKNPEYEQYYVGLEDAYDKYKTAVSNGNKEEIEKTKSVYIKMLEEATNIAEQNNELGVLQWFKDLYPDLAAEASTWEFKVKFTSDTDFADGISNFVQRSKIDKYSIDQLKSDTEDKLVSKRYKDKLKELTGFSDWNQVVDVLANQGLVHSFSKNELASWLGINVEDLEGKYNLSSDQLEQLYGIDKDTLKHYVKTETDKVTKAQNKIKNNVYEDFKSGNFVEDFVDLINGTINNIDPIQNIFDKVFGKKQEQVSQTSWSDFLSQSYGGKAGKELIDDYQSSISSLQSAIEKLDSGEGLNSSEIQDLLEEFPELQSCTEITADELYNLGDKALKSLYDQCGEDIPDNVKQGLQNILETSLGASRNIDKLKDSIDKLKSGFDLLGNVKEDIADGTISSDSLSSILGTYPQMEDAVNSYNAGLIDEQQLYEELQKCYDNDFNNFQTANQAKIYENELFYQSSVDTHDELVDKLSKDYEIDFKNFKTIADLKEAYEAKVLGNLSSRWKQYYDITLGQDGLYKVIATGNGEDYDTQNYEEYIDAYDKAQQLQRFYNDLNDTFDLENVMKNTRDFGNNLKDSDKDNSAKDFKETLDWIEVAITRATEALEKFTEARENAFDTYGDRNSALSEEINQTQELLSLQEQAVEAYRNYAESIALSEDYKEKVRNGTILIEPITDEATKNLIDEYTEWYNKSVDAEKQTRSLKKSLSDLAKTRFDMITSQFDNIIDAFSVRAESINKAIDLTDAKGYAVSTKYYEALIKEETQNIDLLTAKRDELQKSFDSAVSSGAVKETSEEWFNMAKAISDVNLQLEDSNKNLVDFSNTIRQLNWDKFDRLQDTISQITTESEFLISLYENAEMFEDNGKITNEGLTTAGQRAVNYNTLMRQADDYYKEYSSIMQELANDPANQTLIDRQRELVQAQRDAIKSANDEKQALIDLAKEGIQKEIEAMQKLVDVKKKELDVDDNLYKRQQDLADQASNIARINKQLAALQGDTSEENTKRLQQLNKELADAEKKLQETEYENWKSDQQDMLDKLMEEYEESQNERMKNTDKLFNDMLDNVNSNTSVIKETLHDTTSSLGYMITGEMAEIWAGNGEYQNTVSNYVNGADNRVNAVINGIKTQREEQQKVLDDNAKKITDEINPINQKVNDIKGLLSNILNAINSQASSTPTQNTQNDIVTNNSDNKIQNGQTQNSTSTTSSNSTTNGTPEVGDKVYASGRWYTSSIGNEQGIDVANLAGKVDFFKIERIANGATHPYWIQAYKNGVAQGGNGWVDLDQLAGYATGSRRISKDQLAWTNENSMEGIYRASDGAILTRLHNQDMVFTNEQMKKLWSLSKFGFMPNVDNTMLKTHLPSMLNNMTKIGDIKQDIHISLPNVTDPESFKNAIKTDVGLRKQIQSLVFDPMTGKSSFGYKKY